MWVFFTFSCDSLTADSCQAGQALLLARCRCRGSVLQENWTDMARSDWSKPALCE